MSRETQLNFYKELDDADASRDKLEAEARAGGSAGASEKLSGEVNTESRPEEPKEMSAEEVNIMIEERKERDLKIEKIREKIYELEIIIKNLSISLYPKKFRENEEKGVEAENGIMRLRNEIHRIGLDFVEKWEGRITEDKNIKDLRAMQKKKAAKEKIKIIEKEEKELNKDNVEKKDAAESNSEGIKELGDDDEKDFTPAEEYYRRFNR